MLAGELGVGGVETEAAGGEVADALTEALTSSGSGEMEADGEEDEDCWCSRSFSCSMSLLMISS